jgi:integrase
VAREIKRMHPHGSTYVRKTEYKHGQEVVKPLERKDFDEMTRLCTVKRDAAAEGSDEYYRWYRNYVILIVGVNTGNRITTITEQTARDYAGGKYTVVEHKTGKRIEMDINPDVYRIIQNYIDAFSFKNNNYIFRTNLITDRPIARQTAWRMIKAVASEAGIKYCIGTHSLRKSYGRWIYDETHDIFLVQKLLQHNSAEVTQRYICLEDSKVQSKRESINYVPKFK